MKHQPAVARMLADYKTIKELDLSESSFGDDGIQAIISSLQCNAGIWSIDLSNLKETTSKSTETIKDFVRSQPNGTLERV